MDSHDGVSPIPPQFELTGPGAIPQMASYLRIKRKKQTVFLHFDPAERVQDLKLKLQAILNVPADQQMLTLGERDLPNDEAAGLRLRGGEVVFLRYRKEDGSGEYEPVQVAIPDET
ncbi:hypothetical protein PAPYR_2888 [Paratrimastix pyriformis]|uniref:Ubiquitin-like domain-containing protein n=1 Tax=Paratrimastix pyriformis TaxID=342808 RepID=A0ABQ8UT11_9EUKA|nr:hypothetical protein PAPYR_2888 [Paratrimastix pyriformis]